MYATGDVIAEAVHVTTSYTQPPNATFAPYVQILRETLLCCGTLYDEATLEGIFIEGLP